MDSRERLRRAYAHEEMDRPGVYSRTGFPSDDPTYDRLKAYLAEHSDLKVPWRGRAFETPYATHTHQEPHSADWVRVVTTLETPAGPLTSTRLESLRGKPGLHETFFIKTREDALAYLSLPLPALRGDVASFGETDRRIGDRGIVDVALGYNPAGHVAELCGSETFALLSVTDRDVLHALCERQMRLILATVRWLLERGVGPFFSILGQEYLVPPLHGPKDFDDFNVRYDRPILDVIHDAGGYVHIHCHGRIAKVLPGFLALGADVLHPFEGPPMGDITPAEAQRVVGGRLCLEGNIQINRMYEATPEEVRAETEALIADVYDRGTPLIVSPTASPYIRGSGETCFPQYRAMVDAVLAHRST